MWLLSYFNLERNFDILRPYYGVSESCMSQHFFRSSFQASFPKLTVLSKPVAVICAYLTRLSEMEFKMENPTHNFGETNLVLQLMYESLIESKTVISWSSRKKKDIIFLHRVFCPKKIFLTFVFYLNV